MADLEVITGLGNRTLHNKLRAVLSNFKHENPQDSDAYVVQVRIVSLHDVTKQDEISFILTDYSLRFYVSPMKTTTANLFAFISVGTPPTMIRKGVVVMLAISTPHWWLRRMWRQWPQEKK